MEVKKMSNRRNFVKTRFRRRRMMPYTLLALVFCILLATQSVYAEQRKPISPAMRSGAPVSSSTSSQASPSLKPSTASMPLQMPIVLGPAVPFYCENIKQITNNIFNMQKDIIATTECSTLPCTTCLDGCGNLGPYQFFKVTLNDCCSPAKSFSIQDQQAAGCTGSDTVAVCTEKLIRHCISGKSSYSNSKNRLQKMKDFNTALNQKSNQLAQEIQKLLSVIP
jgi:hypothetical protein